LSSSLARPRRTSRASAIILPWTAPRRAVTIVREIVERCQNLAQMPSAFPLVPRYKHLGIRRRPYGNYLIFYRIGPDRVEILHVLNAAQNFEAILFPDAP